MNILEHARTIKIPQPWGYGIWPKFYRVFQIWENKLNFNFHAVFK